MPPSNALIRRDLDQVPALERSLARHALRLFLSDNALLLFASVDPKRTVLLLDEVESFLAHRR